jgi:UDP-glucose 4-epimerase
MKNILVTGGAGYIGSHAVVALVAADFRPVIVDNFSNSEKHVLDGLKALLGHDVTCYDHDYQDSAFIADILKKESIDGVIHFAAHKAVGESVTEPLKYYQNNVSGFIAFLDTLVKHRINTVVLSSSAGVYGEPPTEQVTEDTPCNPTSPYGWTKYMDEVILRDLCTAVPELKATALRYFNVVGSDESALIGELPKGRPQNLLPIIVQTVAGKLPPLKVNGTDYPTPDGTCRRDYIHVVDLANAHIAALKKSFADTTGSYEVYNVGTGTPTSVLEMINTFERINGVKVPHSLGPRRAGDPAACYATPTKANQQLGWKATKTTEDAVRDAWRWQKSLAQRDIKD